MKSLLINHYVDKKLISTLLSCDSLKLEIRAKMIILTDKDNVIFVCKIADFISLSC